MAERARVLSVRHIEDFRAFLVKLGEGVQHGLAAADADVNATQRWLREEHPARLTAERRKAQRALEAAADDLRRKKFTPTATGDPASIAYEKKVAAQCKAKLEWLDEKLETTKRWNRVFDKETDQFLSGTQAARGVAESAVPRALARLEAHLRAIEDYLGVQTTAGTDLSLADGGSASVRRPADEPADAVNEESPEPTDENPEEQP
ncbi:MAG: hypothetical protein AAF333_03365 [Planctomycetota bacterium]